MTPRAWLSFTTTAQFDALKKGVTFVPMAGGSITVTPPAIEGLSMAFTGLAGEGRGEAKFTDLRFVPRPIVLDAELERLDLELLLRYRIPDTALSVFAGPRYVTFEERYAERGFALKVETRVIAAELGAGAAGNLDDRGRHRFFANVMSGLAFYEFAFRTNFPVPNMNTDDMQPFVDVNVGYQYLPLPWLSASVRYRNYLLFFDDVSGVTGQVTAHGPEIGISARF